MSSKHQQSDNFEDLVTSMIPLKQRMIERHILKCSTDKFVANCEDEMTFDFSAGLSFIFKAMCLSRPEWMTPVNIDFQIPTPIIVENRIRVHKQSLQ